MFEYSPQKTKIIEITHTQSLITSLIFRLGNKMSQKIYSSHKDLQRNLILGLNWQTNYKIGC